jgi:SNF2 family DNA or RNA helicase
MRWGSVRHRVYLYIFSVPHIHIYKYILLAVVVFPSFHPLNVAAAAVGKTIQTVGFLHQLRFMSSTQIAGPFLVIAPLSLVDQWQSELNTWSPQMNTILLHGSTEARETIMKHEFYSHEPFTPKSDVVALRKRNVCKFHILLTTFEVATKEIRTLSRVQWQVLIIDEAHKLKNPESKLFSCLVTIPRQHCVLLTGTPLQNRTEELWALLNFGKHRTTINITSIVMKD